MLQAQPPRVPQKTPSFRCTLGGLCLHSEFFSRILCEVCCATITRFPCCCWARCACILDHPAHVGVWGSVPAFWSGSKRAALHVDRARFGGVCGGLQSLSKADVEVSAAVPAEPVCSAN